MRAPPITLWWLKSTPAHLWWLKSLPITFWWLKGLPTALWWLEHLPITFWWLKRLPIAFWWLWLLRPFCGSLCARCSGHPSFLAGGLQLRPRAAGAPPAAPGGARSSPALWLAKALIGSGPGGRSSANLLGSGHLG